MPRWLLFRVFVITGFTLVFCRFSELAQLSEKEYCSNSNVTMHVTGSIVFRSYDSFFALAFMAPFEPPESVLTGFKERIEALSLQGIGI